MYKDFKEKGKTPAKKTTSMDVPKRVVVRLLSGPDGINGHIQRLRQEYRLEVDWNGNDKLTLRGEIADIVYIAVEDLENAAGSKNKRSNKHVEAGRVIWKFDGKNACNFKHLFKQEMEQLCQIASVKVRFEPDVFHPTKSLIECQINMYEQVVIKMDDIKLFLENCKSDEKTVEKTHVALAKDFEGIVFNKFYSKFSMKSKKLEFFSKNEEGVKEGLKKWDKALKEGLTSLKASRDSSMENTQKTEAATVNDTKHLADKPTGTEKPDATEVSKQSIENTKESNIKPDSACPTKKESGRRNMSKSMIVSTNETKGAVPRFGETVKMSTSVREVKLGQKDRKSSDQAQSFRADDLQQLPDVYDAQTDGTSVGQVEDRKPNTVDHLNVKDRSNKREKIGESFDKTQNKSHILNQTDLAHSKSTTGKSTNLERRQPYEFEIERLKIKVYIESITDLKGMDGVTNAANETMTHDGGIAEKISEAAGSAMARECEKFINNRKKLSVTEVFVSNPGKLDCKGIVHVVGPRWSDYSSKSECAKVLYQTVINVLKESKSRKWQRLALCGISAGIFGVPTPVCAEMYVKAFVDFGTGGAGSVKEIHFVDVKDDILASIEDAHKKWLKDPNSLRFNCALSYQGYANMTESVREKFRSSTVEEKGSLIQLVHETKQESMYVISGRITLNVYSRSMIELGPEVGGLVCLYGGRIASTIRRAMGQKSFDEQVEKYMCRRNQFCEGQIIEITGERELSGKQIFSVCIRTAVYEMDTDSMEKISSMMQSVLVVAGRRVKTLAMPLVMPGKIRDTKVAQKMAEKFLHLIDRFSWNYPGTRLDEIHIVDTDVKIIETVKKEYNKLAQNSQDIRSSRHHRMATGPCGDEELPVEYRPAKSPSRINGWTEHQPLPVNTDISVADDFISTARANDDKENNSICPICRDPVESPKVLPCGHQMCSECLEQLRRYKNQCPECNTPFGIITGDQPPGQMFYRLLETSLPGFEGLKTIQIYYNIYSGTQGMEHPSPGQKFKGIERVAFLPDSAEGRRVLHLLRRAFDRRLVFTIGESRTTGKMGVVTWNDIHHKTRQHGGPARFGYPDETYLSRVREELAAKGVTD